MLVASEVITALSANVVTDAGVHVKITATESPGATVTEVIFGEAVVAVIFVICKFVAPVLWMYVVLLAGRPAITLVKFKVTGVAAMTGPVTEKMLILVT